MKNDIATKWNNLFFVVVVVFLYEKFPTKANWLTYVLYKRITFGTWKSKKKKIMRNYFKKKRRKEENTQIAWPCFSNGRNWKQRAKWAFIQWNTNAYKLFILAFSFYFFFIILIARLPMCICPAFVSWPRVYIVFSLFFSFYYCHATLTLLNGLFTFGVKSLIKFLRSFFIILFVFLDVQIYYYLLFNVADK